MKNKTISQWLVFGHERLSNRNTAGELFKQIESITLDWTFIRAPRCWSQRVGVEFASAPLGQDRERDTREGSEKNPICRTISGENNLDCPRPVRELPLEAKEKFSSFSPLTLLFNQLV